MTIHQKVKNAILKYILGSSGELPSLHRPPASASPEAVKYWPTFWKKYGKFVLDSGKGDSDQTWVIAAAIFRNSCLKRNIVPFKETEKVTDTSSREYLQKRFISNRRKLIKNSAPVVKSLLKSKIAKKALTEKFYKVHYNKTKEQISFISVTGLDLAANYSILEPHIDSLLKKKGFELDKHYMLTDGITDLVVYADSEKKNRLNMYCVMHFTPAHVKYIVTEPPENIDTMDKLISVATISFKKLLKDLPGGLMASFTSPFPPLTIDFYAPITKEEEEEIFSIIKNLDRKIADRYVKDFCIDYIIASDNTPQYKHSLVKALVAAFNANNFICPVAWTKAAENPEDWFDPISYIKRIQEEEKHDPYGFEDTEE